MKLKKHHAVGAIALAAVACASFMLTINLFGVQIGSVGYRYNLHDRSILQYQAKRYAYAFYAADPHYYCAALINIRKLKQLQCGSGIGSNPAVIVMHPETWSLPEKLRQVAEVEFGVQHLPVAHLPLSDNFTAGSFGSSKQYYHECMTKLHAFSLTEYDRIIFMDSDAIVVQCLDDLFNLPSVDLAGPRTYWLKPGNLICNNCVQGWDFANGPMVGLQMKFSSALMVVQPTDRLWRRILDTYWPDGKPSPLLHDMYDMDLLNIIFKDEVMLLPPILRITQANWATQDQGGPEEERELPWRGAKVMHFSWPGKPWSYPIDTFNSAFGKQAHTDVANAMKLWWEGAEALQCS